MARPCACYSSCQNLPFIGKDELARAALGDPTKDNRTLTYTPAVLRAPTAVIAIAPVVAPPSDNKLFKEFIKAYLKAQLPSQIASEIHLDACKKSLKA